MEVMLFTRYSLKTFELTIVLLHFSYILGMLWYITCGLIEDFYHDVSFKEIGSDLANELYED